MRIRLLSTMAVLVAAAALPAAAQLTNSDAPVDITADELEVVNTECTATWRGNAEALQDTSRLRAQVLRLVNQRGAAKPGGAAGSSCGEMERMEAEGQVFYVTPQQRVRADKGVYVASTEMLTMTGDVVAVQGQNVIRGTRMVINTRTGQGQMVGAATGRNAQGRVRGVIYPNKQNQAAAR
ncbi:LptA/OstA family protein [Phenylobacterium sp.]|jgi:lipopolysaccharide export system protein LptA|uniref:LptA/OstA family protein n=1 Tax=Phenylobacterium sp. TaxID=1871053 RepID=UPI0037835D24